MPDILLLPPMGQGYKLTLMIPKRLQTALPDLIQSLNIKESPEVLLLYGDASNRQYFRLTTSKQSFILMLLAESGANSIAEEITKTSQPITELPFIDIQRYLSKQNVRVPKIFTHDVERGILALEDLGDINLLEAIKDSNQEKTQQLYEKALDILEKISAFDPKQKSTSIAFARSFDQSMYNWEFCHFIEFALDKRLSKPPTESDRNRIVSALENLTHEYLNWENVLCHRDYHSRNLMILEPNNGQSTGMAVIDFQDALLAPLFYDLASLLRDSYITLEESLRYKLVERYREQMKAQKMKDASSKEEFRRAFDFMGIHRNLKAAGRFCNIDQVKGNPNYLPDVPRTLDYVKQTLMEYSELNELKSCLLPYFDEVSNTCR